MDWFKPWRYGRRTILEMSVLDVLVVRLCQDRESEGSTYKIPTEQIMRSSYFLRLDKLRPGQKEVSDLLVPQVAGVEGVMGDTHF